MTTYKTGNPIGSAAVKDLHDNAENLDAAVNGDAKEWTDRLGRQRVTMKAVEEAVPDALMARDQAQDAVAAAELARDGALVGAEFYPNEAAGRAAVANGEAFKVAGGGDIAAYLYRRIDANQSELLSTLPSSEAVRRIGTQAQVSPALADVVAAVHDEESGRYAPFMHRTGRLLQTDEEGAAMFVPGRGELLPKSAPFSGLIQGERPWKVVLDADDRIAEAWTIEGSYFVAGPGGLVRAGDASEVQERTVPYVITGADTPLYGVNTRLSVRTDDVHFIVVTMGQSNGWGSAETGLPVVAGVPVYPQHALMLEGNTPRVMNSGANALVPCREALADGGEESATTSWLTHTIRDVELLTGHRIKMVGINACQGGTPLRGLMRGSWAYGRAVQAVQEVVNICRAKGSVPIVLAVDWMQGEDESSSVQKFTVKDIERQLLMLKRDFSADVKRMTGQDEDIVWFNTQVALCLHSNPWYSPVRQANVDIDGAENMRLAGPLYQFPTGVGIQNIHVNNTGQNQRGQMLARATVSECFGIGWAAFAPTAARFVSGTQVDIEMQAQAYPLVLDTSGAVITPAGLGPGLGFTADDRSGTPIQVTAAQVQPDGKTVRLTLSRASTSSSVRIGYALQSDFENIFGPVHGGRGCLRDSAASVNAYSGATQHNWANAFAIEVTNI